jgi:hypothetical protein
VALSPTASVQRPNTDTSPSRAKWTRTGDLLLRDVDEEMVSETASERQTA